MEIHVNKKIMRRRVRYADSAEDAALQELQEAAESEADADRSGKL